MILLTCWAIAEMNAENVVQKGSVEKKQYQGVKIKPPP